MAREADLSFVKLAGNVGCLVNGAGLAMATMDLVEYYGGAPANFLDIGGSSNPGKVVNALRIILGDPEVKVVLFNIFGGITRCDDVARGIIEATQAMRIEVPIVVRLTGTNEAEARAAARRDRPRAGRGHGRGGSEGDRPGRRSRPGRGMRGDRTMAIFVDQRHAGASSRASPAGTAVSTPARCWPTARRSWPA